MIPPETSAPLGDSTQEPLPVRMLNEFVYCPRLFYYEHVEGVFLHNADNHLQFSVVECDLSATEKVDLETKLKEIIHNDDDQVLFIELGPTENRGDRIISALGQAYHHFDQPCYVV